MEQLPEDKDHLNQWMQESSPAGVPTGFKERLLNRIVLEAQVELPKAMRSRFVWWVAAAVLLIVAGALIFFEPGTPADSPAQKFGQVANNAGEVLAQSMEGFKYTSWLLFPGFLLLFFVVADSIMARGSKSE